jgi:hypothetical protein
MSKKQNYVEMPHTESNGSGCFKMVLFIIVGIVVMVAIMGSSVAAGL